MFAFYFLIALLIKSTQSFPTAQKRSLDEIFGESQFSDVRLPRDVAPLSYYLEIQPFMDEGEFQGHVVLEVICQDDTDRITLHAGSQLEISESEIVVTSLPAVDTTTTTTTVAPVPFGAARLVPFSSSTSCNSSTCSGDVVDHVEEKEDRAPLRVSKVERLVSKQWIVIYLENRLKRGEKYHLEIKFSGSLVSENKEGIYMEQFVDADWQKKSYVATQMRPNNARRVFPCFDEPSYKVSVTLTIAAKKSFKVIANMPEKSSDEREGWIWHYFETSPAISSHLLAFIISEFSVYEKGMVSVVTRNELAQSPGPNKALEFSNQVIKELQSHFDMPLPVSKLYIAALPGYNNPPDSCWGIIILKESHLTCDNCLLQLLTREIVQQWIGNLITPHWWDGIHLTKSLINFVAFTTEQKLDPAVSSSSRLWLSHYPLYYELSKRNPIHVSSSSQIELILRMLNYTLSGSTFQKSIKQLLNERKYKTFTQDDVWSVLTENAGLDDTLPEPATVSQIAASWLSKLRLPYVKVSRDYEKQTAEVEQHVFIRDLDETGMEDLLWWIPLVIVSQNNLTFASAKPVSWMKEEKRIILDNLPSSTYFIIVNPEEIGPFLVNYDRKNWFLISEYLDRNINNLQIPAGTRAKVVHDALNLAIGGKLRFDSALNVTKFLIHEHDPIVWNAALNLFDHILRQLDGTETMKKLQEYIKIILAPAYLDWEKRFDELTPSEERMLIASKAAMCNAGLDVCVQEARRAWKSWMDAEDPDLGVPVQQSHFCWVFKHGTPEEWEFGHQRFLNLPQTQKQGDRLYLLKTLVSCPNNSDQVERILNYTLLDKDNFSEYTARTLLGSLTSNVGYSALFKILSSNFEALRDRHQNSESRLWEAIVSTATRHFKTQDGLDKVSKLYLNNQGQFLSAEPIIDQSLQQIKKEVKWMDENLIIIDQWLDNYLSRSKN